MNRRIVDWILDHDIASRLIFMLLFATAGFLIGHLTNDSWLALAGVIFTGVGILLVFYIAASKVYPK